MSASTFMDLIRRRMPPISSVGFGFWLVVWFSFCVGGPVWQPFIFRSELVYETGRLFSYLPFALSYLFLTVLAGKLAPLSYQKLILIVCCVVVFESMWFISFFYKGEIGEIWLLISLVVMW
ncbi:MAG: hypothetical protein HGA54_06615, partial [Actinobacteria bacterium]|nr:hypothetical protein [Actinomycetota bacterium]